MNGDVFLLKKGDGGSPTETFTTVDALRGTSYAINGELVNQTDKDSGGWRELLDGGGNKQVTIQADGVWESTTQQKALEAAAMSGALGNYQVDDGDEVLEGGFQVTNFEKSGPQGQEVTYSVTLESSGTPTVS